MIERTTRKPTRQERRRLKEAVKNARKWAARKKDSERWENDPVSLLKQRRIFLKRRIFFYSVTFFALLGLGFAMTMRTLPGGLLLVLVVLAAGLAFFGILQASACKPPLRWEGAEWIYEIAEAHGHLATQALGNDAVEVATLRFTRLAAFRLPPEQGAENCHMLILELSGHQCAIHVHNAPCFSTCVHITHVGRFCLSQTIGGDALSPSLLIAAERDYPDLLDSLPTSPDLPPGWRLLDEPFDTLLARLRKPA